MTGILVRGMMGNVVWCRNGGFGKVLRSVQSGCKLAKKEPLKKPHAGVFICLANGLESGERLPAVLGELAG